MNCREDASQKSSALDEFVQHMLRDPLVVAQVARKKEKKHEEEDRENKLLLRW